MRIYKNFTEAVNEIKRDLAEMGIPIHTKTYQDVNIENDPGMETLELQDYVYKVTGPQPLDLKPTQPWADMEFEERIQKHVNPGEAWQTRRNVWEPFLHDGLFAYTYSERFSYYDQIESVVTLLQRDPNSRQAYISIWHPEDIDPNEPNRKPCSLGYLFQIRHGVLNMEYMMRSCDFITHFTNDIYLAHRMQRLIANILHVPVGHFTHFVASLHIYKKDTEGVF